MILGKRGVLLGAHEPLGLRLVDAVHLDEPAALALGVLAQVLGLVGEPGLDGGDGAGDGGDEVRGGLDGLDGAEGLAGRQRVADGGQLDVDDLAEGLGGVAGDADLGLARGGVDVYPLVGLCVALGQDFLYTCMFS